MKRKWIGATFAGLAAAVAWSFPSVPADSARALGVTRTKPFDSGLVFVNGKFLPPPYTVERWGTGLRINGRNVSGQVIDWSEFLKTQTGVKVTRTEAPAVAEPEPAAAAPAPLPSTPEPDELSSSLDDLFDDNPKPKKPKKAAAPAVVRRAPPKPRATVSYSLDSDFVPNETSKALVQRINATRSEIDRTLRLGGFVLFGDGYARVTGDVRTAEKFMDTLPELLQHCESARELASAARAAGLIYLTDQVCEDLFRNRIDYRALQERRAQRKKDRDLNALLNGSGTPLL